MSYEAILVPAGLLTVVALGILRSVPRRRRRLLLLVPLPLGVLIWRWAAYRDAWAELGIGVALAAASVGLWWLVLGRRLPPPSEDNIRVWTRDDPF